MMSSPPLFKKTCKGNLKHATYRIRPKQIQRECCTCINNQFSSHLTIMNHKTGCGIAVYFTTCSLDHSLPLVCTKHLNPMTWSGKWDDYAILVIQSSTSFLAKSMKHISYTMSMGLPKLSKQQVVTWFPTFIHVHLSTTNVQVKLED